MLGNRGTSPRLLCPHVLATHTSGTLIPVVSPKMEKFLNSSQNIPATTSSGSFNFIDDQYAFVNTFDNNPSSLFLSTTQYGAKENAVLVTEKIYTYVSMCQFLSYALWLRTNIETGDYDSRAILLHVIKALSHQSINWKLKNGKQMSIVEGFLVFYFC